jgi:hypothetical protein
MSTITSTIRQYWRQARDRALPDVGNMPPAVRDEFLEHWWTGMRDRDGRM